MDKLIVEKKNLKCHFCGMKKNDLLKYGPLYKLDDIRAHYYCVLLSNKIIQNGKDDEGILGFLLSDIKKEIQRTMNIICIYCRRGNATITCSAKKCRKTFHLPCGLENGSMHQFINDFKSYCFKHRPFQNIPSKILKEYCNNKAVCCICYDKVMILDKKDVLWAPCCLKTWYHRECVQKLALSAGYFFKCAACNDYKKFNKWMLRFGIFIPQRDASWELVPNAFEELLFRYNKCDAEKCKCPEGRHKSRENTIWEIVLCESCGSQGMHVGCGNLKFMDPEWECSLCRKITKNLKPCLGISDPLKGEEEHSVVRFKLNEVCQRRKRRGSKDLENFVLDKRKKFKTNLVNDEEKEEVEIDVETVEEVFTKKSSQTLTGLESNPDDDVDVEIFESKTTEKNDLQEFMSLLKPGPLSYKLVMIQKAIEDLESSSSVEVNQDIKRNKSPQVIELSDDDEDIIVVEEVSNKVLDCAIHPMVKGKKKESKGCRNGSLKGEKNEEEGRVVAETTPVLPNEFESASAISFQSGEKKLDELAKFSKTTSGTD